jgi:polyprenyl-phospho-N-acetylgalactosaminyl synthase
MQCSEVYIVIPAYNEAAEVLRHTIAPLCAAGYHVVVVDDGSREPLAPALHGLPVTVLRHRLNRGQGAALQTGMSYCRALNAKYCVHFDADGQHDARDIPAMIAALDAGANVALGSRFLRSEDIAAVPYARRCLLRVARIVNGLLTGLWLTDAHNGFRALDRKALSCINLTEDRMAHASEILTQIRDAHLRITEVPTHIIYSQYSTAKGQSAGNALNILLDLIIKKLIG